MIEGLKFFTRTNDRHRINLASWHSPHSLTWRWTLSFARFKGDERRAHWRLLHTNRDNNGLQWMVLLPWIGLLDFHQQPPMWYRDLYVRQRDEYDHARYQASIVRSSPSPRIVVDGGESLH